MPTNYERAFAERPEVYAAWQQLNAAIKANMDLRRYELATLAAAAAAVHVLRLAHGTSISTSASRCARSRPITATRASTRSTSR